MSPLTLAFLGDAVYELFVRDHVVTKGSMPANALHYETVLYVKAAAQSMALDVIYDMLTEEELCVYRRGRNANSTAVPKNASPTDYRRATGLEALFGYLYLCHEEERLVELFEKIWTVFSREFSDKADEG